MKKPSTQTITLDLPADFGIWNLEFSANRTTLTLKTIDNKLCNALYCELMGQKQSTTEGYKSIEYKMPAKPPANNIIELEGQPKDLLSVIRYVENRLAGDKYLPSGTFKPLSQQMLPLLREIRTEESGLYYLTDMPFEFEVDDLSYYPQHNELYLATPTDESCKKLWSKLEQQQKDTSDNRVPIHYELPAPEETVIMLSGKQQELLKAISYLEEQLSGYIAPGTHAAIKQKLQPENTTQHKAKFFGTPPNTQTPDKQKGKTNNTDQHKGYEKN